MNEGQEPLKMTPSVILEKAKERISDRRHWGKKHMALTMYGTATLPEFSDAYRLCPIGALRNVSHQMGYPSFEKSGVLDILRKVISDPSIVCWNDLPSTTHEDVMEAFDKAITISKIQEARS